MKTTQITYPQYRKYNNNKAYFKILSDNEFEEIQVLGNKTTHHIFIAKILPDRNYVYDLVFDYEKHWVVCDSKEFEGLKKQLI